MNTGFYGKIFKFLGPLIGSTILLGGIWLGTKSHQQVYQPTKDKEVATLAGLNSTDPRFSVNCPPTQELLTDDNCPLPVPDFTDLVEITATGIDPSTLTISQIPEPGRFFTGVGERTITMIATAPDGGADTCSFLVELVDFTAPTILKCPDNAILYANDTFCSVVIPDYRLELEFVNSCDFAPLEDFGITQIPTPKKSILSGDKNGLAITLLVFDPSANAAICTFFVTLVDTTGPMIKCPTDQLVSLDSTCEFIVPDYTDSASLADNCVPAISLSLEQVPPPGSLITARGSVQEVFLVGQDNNGNEAICSFSLLLDDTYDPVVECPDRIAITFNEECQGVVPDLRADLVVSDNCTPPEEIIITQTPAPGELLPEGERIAQISFLVDDGDDNTVQCFVTADIGDFSAPEPDSCPPVYVVSIDGSCDLEFPDLTTLVHFTDNCSDSSRISLKQLPRAGRLFLQSELPDSLFLIATDEKDNSDTCAIRLQFEDNIAPALDCPERTEVATGENCDFVIPDFSALLLGPDFCGNENLEYRQNPGPGDVLGTADSVLVQVAVTDEAENESRCSFVVIPEDLSPPQINCPKDSIVFLVNSCAVEVPDYAAILDISDNCTPRTDLDIIQNPLPTTFITGPDTSIRVEINIRDAQGNGEQCFFRLILRDGQGPTVSCPDTLTISPQSDGTYLIGDYSDLVTATDNCLDSIQLPFSQLPMPGTIVELSGLKDPIQFSAIDESGNASTCFSKLFFPSIGLAKGIDSVLVNSNFTYDIYMRFTIENLGNVNLFDLELLDTLQSRIGAFIPEAQTLDREATYTILSGPEIVENTEVPFSPNPNYDGTTDFNLLTPQEGVLQAGEHVVVLLALRVNPVFGSRRLFNQAVVCADRQADAVSQREYVDISTAGFLPDINRNGDATENGENEPTIIVLPGTGREGSIQGTVELWDGGAMPGVQVDLSGDSTLRTFTIADGSFRFNRLLEGKNYQITPSYEGGSPVNGVTTFDIFLIERHILGDMLLPTPQQLVAADIDNSGSVTIRDALLLRRLVLTIDADLTENQNWRFLLADYNWLDETNPWLEPLPEFISINNLNGTEQVDFEGIKVGDVNGTVRLGSQDAEIRTHAFYSLPIQEQMLAPGGIYRVPVWPGEINEYLSLQFGLQLDPTAIRLLDLEPVQLHAVDYGIFRTDNRLTISWIPKKEASSIAVQDIPLCYLKLEVLKPGRLSDYLHLDERRLTAEAVHQDLVAEGIQLQFFDEQARIPSGLDLFPNQPNPFSRSTIIPFSIPRDGKVQLVIHDAQGKIVRSLDQFFVAGTHQWELHLPEVTAEGVFYYSLNFGGKLLTRSMLYQRL